MQSVQENLASGEDGKQPSSPKLAEKPSSEGISKTAEHQLVQSETVTEVKNSSVVDPKLIELGKALESQATKTKPDGGAEQEEGEEDEGDS